MATLHKTSLVGAFFAFILSLSCCWLPALIIGLGGASSMMSFSTKLDQYSGAFMIIGALMLGFGAYKFYQIRNRITEILLHSTITCPECNHKQKEEMPTDACQYFYECQSCNAIIKPIKGDCCVYCSYGDVKCPPIQSGELCCD